MVPVDASKSQIIIGSGSKGFPTERRQVIA